MVPTESIYEEGWSFDCQSPSEWGSRVEAVWPLAYASLETSGSFEDRHKNSAPWVSSRRFAGSMNVTVACRGASGSWFVAERERSDRSVGRLLRALLDRLLESLARNRDGG